MSTDIIGIIIGIVGFLLGSIIYFKGWNDCKEFIFTELDKTDDECMVYMVRRMAKELKGGQDDKS